MHIKVRFSYNTSVKGEKSPPYLISNITTNINSTSASDKILSTRKTTQYKKITNPLGDLEKSGSPFLCRIEKEIK
jgi:hypothetical protein